MKLKGIVLVGPKYHANVGGIARSMKAFGFDNLIIVNKPDRMRLDKARRVSEQGKSIIKDVKLVKSLSEVEGVKVATISRFDNAKYGFSLKELKEVEWPEEFYLVMGREGYGLTYEEMKECDYHITIATNGKYGVLNLCQSTTIILHELSRYKKYEE